MLDGTARCWGDNVYGQLGNNSTTDSSVPVKVVNPSNAAQALTGIASVSPGLGFHSCALMQDGTARCWGQNAAGALGNNTTSNSSVPVTVVNPANTALPLTGLTIVTAGYYHSCALVNDGTARCWGYNGSGRLGNNTTVNSLIAVVVVNPSNTTLAFSRISSMTAGGYQSCALMIDGTAYCWGENVYGSLGNDTTAPSKIPVKVLDPSNTTQALTGVARIAAGGYHSCTLMTDATARCWGYNTFGQLGNHTFTDSAVPATVSTIR